MVIIVGTRRRIQIAALAGLLFTSAYLNASAGTECPQELIPDNCSLEPIELATTGNTAEGNRYPAGTFGLEFSAFLPEYGGSTCRIEPVLKFTPVMSGLADRISSQLRPEIERPVRNKGLDLKSFWLKSVRASGRTLVYTYGLTIADYAKFDWICCKGLKCGKCRKEVQLWQKSGEIVVTASLRQVPVPELPAPSPANPRSPTSSYTDLTPNQVAVDFAAVPSVNYNDFERILDLHLGVIDAVLGEDIQVIDLWRSINSSSVNLGQGPIISSPESYLTDESCGLGYEARAIALLGMRADTWSKTCAALSQAFEMNFAKSDVSASNGFTFYNEFNRERFLDVAGTEIGSTALLTNRGFCLRGSTSETNLGRKVYSDFLHRLVKGVEGSAAEGYAGPSGALPSHLSNQYHLSGLEHYIATTTTNPVVRDAAVSASWGALSSSRMENEANANRGNVEPEVSDDISEESDHINVDLKALSEIAFSAGMVTSGSSLWHMATYEDWGQEEYACAMQWADLWTGEADLVYAGMSFARCLGGRDSARRVAKLEEAVERFNADIEAFQEAELSRSYSNPLDGDLAYRGWYYCDQNPRICRNKKAATWWQAPSTYGARGGRHRGFDIFSSATEADPVMAFATGKLTYHFDRSGWGHSLLLAFKQGSKDLVAVYAHLPSSARQLDGKNLRSGESFGINTGCTGNAGNGGGKCNDWCLVNGSYRTDRHLHFEILDPSTCESGRCKAIDPFTLHKPRISNNRVRKLHVCEASGDDLEN